MQNSKYLFVYGSLRSGFKSTAYEYIAQYFNFVSVAKTKGILYNLGTHPVAKPTDDNNYIIGELYEVSNPKFASYAFAQLDDYEGIDNMENENTDYIKTLSTIETANHSYTAIVYWYNGNVNQATIIESGDVMDFKVL